MSNTKFTKGEWAVSIQGFDDFKSIAVIVPNGGFEVTNIPDAEANAHLIAAAPDMYHYLDELKNKMIGNKAIEYKNQIEQLLKKARGE